MCDKLININAVAKNTENYTEILYHIIDSEDLYILGINLAETFYKEISADDNMMRKDGNHIMRCVSKDKAEKLMSSVCGTVLRNLMIKAKILKDVDLEHHSEYIDAVFTVKDDEYGQDEEYFLEKHNCKINMRTFEVIDICDGVLSREKTDYPKDEWVEIDGDIYPVYPQDESECLPYHVFWYGENE